MKKLAKLDSEKLIKGYEELADRYNKTAYALADLLDEWDNWYNSETFPRLSDELQRALENARDLFRDTLN